MSYSQGPRFQQVESASVVPGISLTEQECADRHLKRAKDQIKLKNLKLAVQELRDAIQIDPHNSEYHALLAKIHLDRGMVGMATVSLRQALKLNPKDAIALECQQRLQQQAKVQQPQKSGGFLGGLFGNNRR